MTFSQRLNDIMISRNITNYEMSKKTGVSDSLIGYWRKGERVPKADNLIIIANFLDVSTDYLLGREELQEESIDPMTKILITHFNKLSPQDKIDFLNAVVQKSE